MSFRPPHVPLAMSSWHGDAVVGHTIGASAEAATLVGVLRFTDETGQPVHQADGSCLGVLRDLTIDLDDAGPIVRRLVVGKRNRVLALVGWEAVASFEHTLVQLGPGDGAQMMNVSLAADLPLGHGELLLGRDVLDTQIVDIAGARLARVGEILLTRLPNEELVVAAVDVGFGSVARRVGVRWLADRLHDEAVEWDALHLTSARGHRVQLATTKSAVHRLEGPGLAVLLSRLSAASGAAVLSAVHPSRAAIALAASHPEVADAVVRAMADQDLAPVLDALPPQHAGRLRSVLGRARRRRYLRHRGRRRPAMALPVEFTAPPRGDQTEGDRD